MIGYLKKSKAKQLFKKEDVPICFFAQEDRVGISFQRDQIRIQKKQDSSIIEEGKVFLTPQEQQKIVDFLKEDPAKEISFYMEDEKLCFEGEEKEISLTLLSSEEEREEKVEKGIEILLDAEKLTAAIKDILQVKEDRLHHLFVKEHKLYISSVSRRVYTEVFLCKIEEDFPEFSFELSEEEIRELLAFKKGDVFLWVDPNNILYFFQEEKGKSLEIWNEVGEQKGFLADNMFTDKRYAFVLSEEMIQKIREFTKGSEYKVSPIIHLKKEDGEIILSLEGGKEVGRISPEGDFPIEEVSFSSFYFQKIPVRAYSVFVEHKEKDLRLIEVVSPSHRYIFGEKR